MLHLVYKKIGYMFNLVISIICFQLILELDAEPIKEHNV